MDRFGPFFEVYQFSRLDRSDRNGPFHLTISTHSQSQYLAVWYFPRTTWSKTLIIQLFWIVKADLSVLLIHPCAVTTGLQLLRKPSVCFWRFISPIPQQKQSSHPSPIMATKYPVCRLARVCSTLNIKWTWRLDDWNIARAKITHTCITHYIKRYFLHALSP